MRSRWTRGWCGQGHQGHRADVSTILFTEKGIYNVILRELFMLDCHVTSAACPTPRRTKQTCVVATLPLPLDLLVSAKQSDQAWRLKGPRQ
jgi:hypothetical protein